MVGVILADKYTENTTKKIIKFYKQNLINEIIVCKSSQKEEITEDYEDGALIYEFKLGKEYSFVKQLSKLENMISGNEFFVIFGNVISNVNLEELLKFHKSNSVAVTIGVLKNGNQVRSGGVMIFDTDVFGYIKDEYYDIEEDLLKRIMEDNEVAFYKIDDIGESIYKSNFAILR